MNLRPLLPGSTAVFSAVFMLRGAAASAGASATRLPTSVARIERGWLLM
jgi:hypothetical protein